MTTPRSSRARQPRLASPRIVNMEPESLSMSRRGSGRWRSSSGSGLSMLQFEGSADNENCRREKKWEGGQRTVDGGDRDVCDTLSTSDLVDPSYRESS